MSRLICCLALLLSVTACAETRKERESYALIMPKGDCYQSAMRDLNSELPKP